MSTRNGFVFSDDFAEHLDIDDLLYKEYQKTGMPEYEELLGRDDEKLLLVAFKPGVDTSTFPTKVLSLHVVVVTSEYYRAFEEELNGNTYRYIAGQV